jgi:hypothetical protein
VQIFLVLLKCSQNGLQSLQTKFWSFYMNRRSMVTLNIPEKFEFSNNFKLATKFAKRFSNKTEIRKGLLEKKNRRRISPCHGLLLAQLSSSLLPGEAQLGPASSPLHPLPPSAQAAPCLCPIPHLDAKIIVAARRRL